MIPLEEGMAEPPPFRSITVWYKCEVCSGYIHSIPALKTHALTVHGVTILKLPQDLRPGAEHGKVFTDYSKNPPPKQYPYTQLNSYRLEQEEKEKEMQKEADNSRSVNGSIRLPVDTSLNKSSDDDTEGDESVHNANIELNSSSSSAPDTGIQLLNPANDDQQPEPGPSKKSRTLNPPPPPVMEFNSPSKLKFQCALCLKRFSSNQVLQFHIKKSHVFDKERFSRNEVHAAEETDSSSQASDSDAEMLDSSLQKDDEPQPPAGDNDKADETESRKRKSPSPRDISTSSNDSTCTALIPRKAPSKTGSHTSQGDKDNQNTPKDTDSSPEIRTRGIVGKKKSKSTNSIQSDSEDELGTRSTVSQTKSSPPRRTRRRGVRLPPPPQSEMIASTSGRVTRRMTRSAGPPSPPPASASSKDSFIVSSSSSDSSSSSGTKEVNESGGEESEGELTDKSTTPDAENVASVQDSGSSSSSDDLFIPIITETRKKKSKKPKETEGTKDSPPSPTPSSSSSPVKNQPSTSQPTSTSTSTCDACGMEFKEELELASHKKNPLECKGSTGPYQCEECKKEYKDKRTFSRHMGTHKNPNKIRLPLKGCTKSARPSRRRK